MINHIKTATLYSPAVNYTINDYGERIAGAPTTRTIHVAISLRSGDTQNMNNVISVTSSHVGVTQQQGIKENDVVVYLGNSYKVDYSYSNGKRTIMYLSRVNEHGV